MSCLSKTRRGAHPRTRRAGVSILEVLIAVGVATIGLFGVWALIPIAAQRVEQGLLSDAKSVFGQSAFNDFSVRGMGQPENWLDSGGLAIQDRAANPLTPYIPWSSYCLDPEFIAANAPGGAVFPASTTATITMPRITLRSGTVGGVMNAQQAREVFRTRDDIEIRPGESEGDPAEQHFLLSDLAIADTSRRYADQRLSWFATLTPAATRQDGSLPNSGYGEYVLSVIVVNERDLTLPTGTPDDSERTFQVTNFYGGGVGGGDIQIDASDVELKRGDWLMLSQEIVVPPGPNLQRHRWYRVVAFDPSTGTSDITLEGPDWDSIVAVTTQCTYVPGVVAVYEKVIRLETSSMWK